MRGPRACKLQVMWVWYGVFLFVCVGLKPCPAPLVMPEIQKRLVQGVPEFLRRLEQGHPCPRLSRRLSHRLSRPETQTLWQGPCAHSKKAATSLHGLHMKSCLFSRVGPSLSLTLKRPRNRYVARLFLGCSSHFLFFFLLPCVKFSWSVTCLILYKRRKPKLEGSLTGIYALQ